MNSVALLNNPVFGLVSPDGRAVFRCLSPFCGRQGPFSFTLLFWLMDLIASNENALAAFIASEECLLKVSKTTIVLSIA